jgi:hypothetical protein
MAQLARLRSNMELHQYYKDCTRWWQAVHQTRFCERTALACWMVAQCFLVPNRRRVVAVLRRAYRKIRAATEPPLGRLAGFVRRQEPAAHFFLQLPWRRSLP